MIREIFNAITPEHIRTNPLYEAVIETFLDEIEEKSKYSININEVFKSEDPVIKLQIIKTYLNSFYEVLSGIQTSNFVGDVYANEAEDVVPRVEDILSYEYLASSKTFKESKGTKTSIGYVYSLIEKMNTVQLASDTKFHIDDTKSKFHFDVEGNLTAEVYDQLVKPLSHPAGFAYVYTQVLSELIHDYFNMQTEYKDVTLKVICQDSPEPFDFVGLGSVVITGPAVSGSTLTASVSDINTNFLTAYSYIWKDELGNVLGASKNLVLDNFHIGKQIFVDVSYIETIDSINYNRTVFSKIKPIINGASTVQVADSVGRVYVTGNAVFDETLGKSTPQELKAEIFDSVGINYSTLKYIWHANEVLIDFKGSALPININFVGKKITVQVEYTDVLGTPKVLTDTIDKFINHWEYVGSVSNFGTSYRIVDVQEEKIKRDNLLRIEFACGEYLEQLTSSVFTSIKWYGPTTSPYDWASRELIKDFTTNLDLTTNQCSLDFGFTAERNSLIDDNMVTDLMENGAFDNFWVDVDNIIRIGNAINIGRFKVGQGVDKSIIELVNEACRFYPVLTSGSYKIPDEITPHIGLLNIGGTEPFIIGRSTGYDTILTDTEDNYNLRTAQETITFEVIEV